MKPLHYIAITLLLVPCIEVIHAQTEASTTTSTLVQDTEVKETLSFLASDQLQGRAVGTQGFEDAVAYIEKKLKSYGVVPYFETYKDTFTVNGVQTANVVGFIKGTDPVLSKETIIIGAHLDHLGTAIPVDGDQIANGANDNASGSTVVLLLAKYFATYPPKRSVLFTWFSAEEKGLLGSAHLASKLQARSLNLYTMLNFEMVGVPLQDKPYTAYLTGYEYSTMASVLNTYAKQEFIGFLPQAKEYNLFQRSDNYLFYQVFQVPSQTISTFDFTNYDYYHHVDDEADQLDFEFMASFINDFIPILTKVCNAATSEIQMKEH